MSSIGEASNHSKQVTGNRLLSSVQGARADYARSEGQSEGQSRELIQRIMVRRSEFSDTLNKFVENLSNTGKDTKQGVAMLVDLFSVCAALACAFILRLSTVDLNQLWPVFIIVPAATVMIFSGIGVYRLVIRFSGLDEMAPIVKGVILSSLLVLITLFLLAPEPNPRSIFVIYGLLLLVFCGSARQIWRGIASDSTSGAGIPVAIYGAGALGRQVMQICRNGSDYKPVLWLDDDRKIHGRTLSQVKVLDPRNDFTPAELSRCGVETILMAIPSVRGPRMKELLESLQKFNCVIKTLPSIEDIMTNRVTSRDIQTLPLEELIGRQPVAPDMALMSKNISNKVVMVTGAGGSVGGELCRQIVALNPKAIVLLDVSEAAMYTIDCELRELMATTATNGDTGAPEIHCVLGNVVFKDQMRNTIKHYGVKTLFHAAAYKHVPMVENNPQPAIRTNIFGTLATLEAAIENQVENFLLVSTDKAVRPTNIMGATKRVAEMIVQAKAAKGADGCKLSMVRFGNVIGSSGSVVPKFSEQIEQGGPITVTHREIVRFFMSIPEAAQLVIQASALAEGGDVFLLDMGKPVRIADLAKSLIYLHGKTLKDENNPKGEIEINYTGLREGEKLFEELLIDDLAIPTVHPKISKAREEFLDWETLKKILDNFLSTMEGEPNNQMIEQLKSVVGGYKPNRSPHLSEVVLQRKKGDHTEANTRTTTVA